MHRGGDWMDPPLAHLVWFAATTDAQSSYHASQYLNFKLQPVKDAGKHLRGI